MSTRLVTAAALVLCACGTPDRDQTALSGFGPPGTDGDDTGGPATSDDGDGGDDGGDGDSGPGDDGDGDDGADIKFDTQEEGDGDGDGGDKVAGCEKIDFLFVIDNSGSMGGEQQSLVTSFPGFLSAIQDTLMAQDYQIMVVDTDADNQPGFCQQSTCCNVDCVQWCAQCLQQGCDCTCNGQACPKPPQNDCDIELGAGKTKSQDDVECGIQGDKRFMLESQPDLNDTFACTALVGTGGDGSEKPMQAMMDGLTALNDPGGCNEGFVRDDAILVVTVITDEEDHDKSDGDPAYWKQVIVDAKLGEPLAVVPLALVGDTDLQNPVCAEYDGEVGAEGAPRIRQWAESFEHGLWGSVCADDYSGFFEQAVSQIDLACDEFIPEG